MTQVRKRRPATPSQAARCGGPLDELLRPELFKAFCDPTRASLIACLAKCGRACTVGEVAECCSVDFSVVSRHLALLARAGVFESTKRGRTVLYRVRYRELSAVFKALATAIDECCPPCAASAGDGTCCG